MRCGRGASAHRVESGLPVAAVTPVIVATVIAAGAVAGGLGTLLGIGGGVFLVPFLNAVLGIDFKVAAALSLVTVIATSSAVSANTTGRHLINLRLGMILEVASAAGGLAAATTVAYVSNVSLERGFAVVAGLIAILMLSRLERRNVLTRYLPDPGTLGGRFYDEETRRGQSSTGYNGCRWRSVVSFAGWKCLRCLRHRRRDSESAGAERMVRRADARRRGNELTDDWRDCCRLGPLQYSHGLSQSAASRRRRCSAC